MNRKPISGYSQEIVMLQEINIEDTSPSVRSLRFPKLQIFVEIVCANLQSSDRYGAAMLVSLCDTLFFNIRHLIV